MTTKRIITGAHYGVRDWLGQRITAIGLVLYTIYLLVRMLAVPELTYSTWYGLFLSPFMRVVTLLAMLALIYHAWVGIRDVLMDYIQQTWMRLTLEILTIALEAMAPPLSVEGTNVSGVAPAVDDPAFSRGEQLVLRNIGKRVEHRIVPIRYRIHGVETEAAAFVPGMATPATRAPLRLGLGP